MSDFRAVSVSLIASAVWLVACGSSSSDKLGQTAASGGSGGSGSGSGGSGGGSSGSSGGSSGGGSGSGGSSGSSGSSGNGGSGGSSGSGGSGKGGGAAYACGATFCTYKYQYCVLVDGVGTCSQTPAACTGIEPTCDCIPSPGPSCACSHVPGEAVFTCSGAAGAAGAAGAPSCDVPATCTLKTCCGGTPGTPCDPSPCQWSCGSPSLCPSLSLIAGAGGPPADPTIVACVMTALRDGTEGSVSWSELGTVPGGSYGQTITIRAGRKALRDVTQNNDLAPTTYAKDGPSDLQPSAFFDACMTATDPAAILACLKQATAGCGLPLGAAQK